jgi:hypothetical protein
MRVSTRRNNQPEERLAARSRNVTDASAKSSIKAKLTAQLRGSLMQLCGDRGQRAAAWCLTLLNKNKFLLPEKARDPKHQSVAVLRHAWRGAAAPPPVKLADAPRHEPGASNLSTTDLR